MIKDKNNNFQTQKLITKIKPSQLTPQSRKIGLKLICQICKYIALEPYCSTKCGHLFCKECLNNLLHNLFKCPKDKEIVNRDDTRKYYMDYYLDTISCHCIYRSTGCYWTGYLSEYQSHISKGH